jgi:hypothetical protein
MISELLKAILRHWYMEPTLLVSYRLPRQCWNRDAYKFSAKFVWNNVSDDCSIGIPEFLHPRENEAIQALGRWGLIFLREKSKRSRILENHMLMILENM